MNREAVGSRVTDHFDQIVQWHCANAMRRDADPCTFVWRLPLYEGIEGFGIIYEILRSRSDEPCLAGIRFFLPACSHVCCSEQGDPDSDFVRGPENLFRQEIAILIWSAVRGVMQVVKLAYRCDSRQRHLE